MAVESGDAELRENPAFGGARDEGGEEAQQVDIEAALRDGTLTQADAIVQMQKQMDQLAKALSLAELKEGQEASAETALSRMMATPMNWHQATVQAGSTGVANAAWFLVTAIVIVIVQCLAALGLFQGIVLMGCVDSDQCPAGMYCGIVEDGGRCNYCGDFAPLPLQTTQTGTLNDAAELNFEGFNTTLVDEVCSNITARTGWSEAYGQGGESYSREAVQQWCEYCVHPIDRKVVEISTAKFAERNLGMMTRFDWLTLAFASTMVAFKLSGELTDIELCRLAVAHGRDGLSSTWRIALQLIAYLRRWYFLPTVLVCITVMVRFRGGDAMSVCLNAIGVIFLCDIDNILFNMALNDATKVEIQRGLRAGKLGQIDDAEASALYRSKLIHVFLFVVYVIFVCTPLVETSLARVLMPYWFVGLGAGIDGCLSGSSTADKCIGFGKGIATGVIASVVGTVVFLAAIYN